MDIAIDHLVTYVTEQHLSPESEFIIYNYLKLQTMTLYRGHDDRENSREIKK